MEKFSEPQPKPSKAETPCEKPVGLSGGYLWAMVRVWMALTFTTAFPQAYRQVSYALGQKTLFSSAALWKRWGEASKLKKFNTAGSIGFFEQTLVKIDYFYLNRRLKVMRSRDRRKSFSVENLWVFKRRERGGGGIVKMILMIAMLALPTAAKIFEQEISLHRAEIEKAIGRKRYLSVRDFCAEKNVYRTTQLMSIRGVGEGSVKKLIEIIGLRFFYAADRQACYRENIC